MSDILDDPEFRRWASRVQRELVPKLQASAMTVSLVPKGPSDIKFAVELGLSIMLDKPIVALVHPGMQVPERLVRVVDEIVEADVTTPEGQAKAAGALKAALERLRIGR